MPGILTAKDGQIFSVIQEEFDNIGYTILSGNDPEHKNNIIDFSDYGVFQRRKRVVLFGFKKELNYTYPDFSRFTEKFHEQRLLSTRDENGHSKGAHFHGKLLCKFPFFVFRHCQ